MKFNRFYLIAGIAIVVLAMTVFANAQTFTFDCSVFGCSLTKSCMGQPNAVQGMVVQNGGCGYFSNPTNPSSVFMNQNCDYPFISNTVGEHVCSIQATVTGFSGTQSNERTTIRINGRTIATTNDNCCNSSSSCTSTCSPCDSYCSTRCSSCDCIFCGRDIQNLGFHNIELVRNNTISFIGENSHAIVSVVVNCTPVYNKCSDNIVPLIRNIPNKIIPYNSSFSIDLWNYVSDVDDYTSDLNIAFIKDNNNISCTLDNNRYLDCVSSTVLGDTNIIITVNDSCGERASKSFNVNVYNNPPTIMIPDYTKSCVSDLNKIIDLRNFSTDEENSTVTYSLISQSNTTLLNCRIVDGRYVSCDLNNCSDDYTDLNIRVTDRFNLTSTDTFRITLKNSAPYWKSIIPNKYLNSSSSKFINLADYAYDLEDKNNLSFAITSQSNIQDIDCFIEDNNYLSCRNISNKKVSSLINVKTTDSKGLFANTSFTISTNCFDNNIIIDSQEKDICLEYCTSYATSVQVSNFSGVRECFNFQADTGDDSFNVSLMNNQFCLNNKESTSFTISAKSCSNSSKNYAVKLYDEDNNVSMNFNYRIGECKVFGSFVVAEDDTKICQGEIGYVPVQIQNLSTNKVTFLLNADSSMVFPYFEKEKITLNSNEGKYVDLVINAKNLSLGKYKIQLSADAPNVHIEKLLEVEVVDCTTTNRNFLLKAPNVCYDVSRGQLFEGSFTIKRLKEDDCDCCECSDNLLGAELFLGIDSYELSENKVELKCGEEKRINYLINIPTNASKGILFVDIYGNELKKGLFDDDLGFILPKEICFNVAGETNSTVSLRTQAKDIDWCDSEIFELEIINSGDFDENFSFSATNLPAGVRVSFSEDNVLVRKGTSKIIYVSISTTPESRIANDQFVTINLSGTKNLSAKIYFNIKEKPSFNDLEIVSATKEIAIFANEETTYDILLKNNTEFDLNNVKISFEIVPLDVNFETVIIPVIKSGKIVQVSGKIIVGDVNGYFEPIFSVSSGSIINKKKIALFIQKPSSFDFSGTGFFGLFSLGEGIIALPIVLFLILLILIFVLGFVSITKNESKKEAWMEARDYE